MALGSSEDTVAILYDNENTPFEMLDFALKEAKRFLPCRLIVIADWDECPDQKRWQKLMSRPGFTFRQIERTREGENSLDYALAATAMMMCREGVARFMFITNDADFADIAKALRQQNPDVFLVGVGAEQANQTLRAAYNMFICYKGKQDKKTRKSKVSAAASSGDATPEIDMKNYENDDLKLQTSMPQQTTVVLSKGTQSKEKKQGRRKANSSETNAVQKSAKLTKVSKTSKVNKEAKDSKEKVGKQVKKTVQVTDVSTVEKKQEGANGELAVRIPKTLHQQLMERAAQENVDMGQLVTFLLMQGISK